MGTRDSCYNIIIFINNPQYLQYLSSNLPHAMSDVNVNCNKIRIL